MVGAGPPVRPHSPRWFFCNRRGPARSRALAGSGLEPRGSVRCGLVGPGGLGPAVVGSRRPFVCNRGRGGVAGRGRWAPALAPGTLVPRALRGRGERRGRAARAVSRSVGACNVPRGPRWRPSDASPHEGAFPALHRPERRGVTGSGITRFSQLRGENRRMRRFRGRCTAALHRPHDPPHPRAVV